MAKAKPTKKSAKSSKPVAKAPAAKAKGASKPVAKPVKKAAPSPSAKSAGKKAAVAPKKSDGKKTEAKKVTGKKADTRKVEPKQPKALAMMESKGKSKVASGEKPVEAKAPEPKVEAKRPPHGGKPQKVKIEMPNFGPLIGPGKKPPKPLIQSGWDAPKVNQKTIDVASLKGKSTMSKKDLEHYRSMLIRKRAELVGDINTMEGQALKDPSGSLSNVPQHAAEQGSDAYDQSLNLEIAEVDRNLLREIDDALQRIEDLSYGLCQATGKAITKERLEELPWTRYSIEAARERERKQFFVPRGSAAAELSRSGGGSSSSGD